ncbi:MAG TPA: hypothetical protein PLP71_09875 [Syntrophomonadaceae bacterium]|nr:hypothetical protein [Syntrophomonadaceae bacterium]
MTSQTSQLSLATIEWTSNNENVITNDGKVIRPSGESRDAIVTLTATINQSGVDATLTKIFVVTVKALEPVDETPIIYSVVVTDSEGNEINEGETLSREVTFEVISGDDKALQQLNIDFVKESLRGEDNQC